MLRIRNKLSLIDLSCLGGSLLSHLSRPSEPPKIPKSLLHPHLSRTRCNQTITSSNGRSTRLLSSVQDQGALCWFPKEVSSIHFRPSVGSLPIGNSPRQATMFMCSKEMMLRVETGITPTSSLLIPLSQMQTFLSPTSHLRSLPKEQNFLILRSTRTRRLQGNCVGLIVRLNLYGLL